MFSLVVLKIAKICTILLTLDADWAQGAFFLKNLENCHRRAKKKPGQKCIKNSLVCPDVCNCRSICTSFGVVKIAPRLRNRVAEVHFCHLRAK